MDGLLVYVPGLYHGCQYCHVQRYQRHCHAYPDFLIGFPLLGLLRLSTVAAIGTSLFLETSGFGTGLYRYLCLRLVDVKTVKTIILVTLPLGAIGAIAARHVPVQALRLGYGAAMLGLS